MELALSALVSAFVIAPGIAWRFSFWASPYAEGQGSEEYTPLARATLRLILAGLVAHAIGIAVVHCATEYEVRLADVIALVSGSDAIQAAAVERLMAAHAPVVRYFAFLVVGTWLLGRGLRAFIARFDLDEPQYVADAAAHWLQSTLHLPAHLASILGRACGRAAHSVRFDAPWTELLLAVSPPVAFTMVYAVVLLGERPVIYVGEVERLHFDRGGALDRLVLRNVERWKFEDGSDGAEASDEGTRHDMSFGYVVLPYAKIENLYVIAVVEEPET